MILSGKFVSLGNYNGVKPEEILAIINNPSIRQYLSPKIAYPLTMKDQKEWLEKQTAHNSDETYSFAIRHIDSNEYLGDCGILKMDRKNSVAIIFILLNTPYQGKGYGTEALQLLLKFIFEEINVNKVSLDVYSFNEKAIKLYKKCGFVEEGRKRQEAYRFGKYHDGVYMGILKSEWVEKQRDPVFVT